MEAIEANAAELALLDSFEMEMLMSQALAGHTRQGSQFVLLGLCG
jgi:hypothetical protein